jgi:hypothetical protein
MESKRNWNEAGWNLIENGKENEMKPEIKWN